MFYVRPTNNFEIFIRSANKKFDLYLFINIIKTHPLEGVLQFLMVLNFTISICQKKKFYYFNFCQFFFTISTNDELVKVHEFWALNM
jgi:hypothetical protein